ncbi:hypothetical protein Efla_002005 [Eimeria flavescens]
MSRAFVFSRHQGGGDDRGSPKVGSTIVTGHTGQAASMYYPARQGFQAERLRQAFKAISLASGTLQRTRSSRGFQSVPASRSSSLEPSPAGSKPSSGQSTPTISRQQSFTFTPPSWRDSSFVSWKPTQAIPRLERTASTPGLPHKLLLTTDDSEEPETFPALQGTPVAVGSTPGLEEGEFAMPVRQPCIVGWAEIENAKCVLINPIADRPAVFNLVNRGRKFLKAVFGIAFTEELLEPHTRPEVISCLEALRAASDSSGECTVQINPQSNASRPSPLRKTSSGEVAELPFDIRTVWHLQLSKEVNRNVYGRCETRFLTFPPLAQPAGHGDQEQAVPRTYRVVQSILLSRYVPEGLIYGHLVHELLHAFIWLSLDNNSVKIDLAAEEGLCNCILAAALQLRVEALQAQRQAALDALLFRGVSPKTAPGIKEVQGIPEAAEFVKAIAGAASTTNTTDHLEASQQATAEQSISHLEYCLYVAEYELKVLNRRLGEMEKDSDPAYGVGYRTIRDLLMNLPVARLIKVLARHGETLQSVVQASKVITGKS